jgi:Arc-like DNA binding dprotein
MPTSNFNLRNLPPEVMSLLRKKATKQKISMNSLILQIIEQGLGIVYPAKRTIFHDLDHLAGTWSREDKQSFNDNMHTFEKLDKELWS